MADNTPPTFNPNMHPVPRNPNLVRPPPPDHPYFAPMRPEASWERLQEPSSRVKVTNTSEVQQHVVIDRFMVGHELRPGHSVEIEMVNDEIARFQEMRKSGRFYPVIDPAKPGREKPPHPIKIEGVGSMIEEAADRQDERMRALHAERQAAREAAMAVPKGKGRGEMATGADIAAFKVAIPEFAAMTDPELSSALDETDMWLEAAMWHPPDFVWARWYLTAHNIKMALGIGGSVASGGGSSSEISSDLFVRMVAFGERRVMFGERKVSTSEGQITGPGASEFDDTIYGQKFLRLRSRNIPPVLSV